MRESVRAAQEVWWAPGVSAKGDARRGRARTRHTSSRDRRSQLQVHIHADPHAKEKDGAEQSSEGLDCRQAEDADKKRAAGCIQPVKGQMVR